MGEITFSNLRAYALAKIFIFTLMAEMERLDFLLSLRRSSVVTLVMVAGRLEFSIVSVDILMKTGV